MHSTAQAIRYSHTHKFSKIVLDYINGAPDLRPFYAQPPTLDGLKKAIQHKERQPPDRQRLVSVLGQQYSSVTTSKEVAANIHALLSPSTFTVCTAHQPNLFTGPLYFIYKILHAIKLAEYLQSQFPDKHFVPVYYMGSEDADVAELNHFTVAGKKYEWSTTQKGAVGRMKVDKALGMLIDELEGQLGVEPWGPEFTGLLKQYYTPGSTIQMATFSLVNALFHSWGLVVLIPDHPELKRSLKDIFEQDLFHQASDSLVALTSAELNKRYKAQAHSRDINIFYLTDDIRERIVRTDDGFAIHNTALHFTREEMLTELDTYPDRFSPNVILRGLLQETILPNIAFIGGGGEIAYWLQLNSLFDHYDVPFPVLVLRNSFLVIEKRWQELRLHLKLTHEQLFEPELKILDSIIEGGGNKPLLNGQVSRLAALYDVLKEDAAAIDATLAQHVESLKKGALKGVSRLEKKLLRSERRKLIDTQRQIQKLLEELFPKNNLQERVENLSLFYAKWGPGFIQQLYGNSLTLEQQFVVLEIE